MYTPEKLTLFFKVDEQTFVRHLEAVFGPEKPVIRNTPEGNKKMVVRGWSLVIVPEAKGISVVIIPMWVHSQEGITVNLLNILTTISFSN